MAEANDPLGLIYQNLTDAGCDEQTIARCMRFAEQKNRAGIRSVLIQFRVSLLNQVRRGQKQLDCLDFMIYKFQDSPKKDGKS